MSAKWIPIVMCAGALITGAAFAQTNPSQSNADADTGAPSATPSAVTSGGLGGEAALAPAAPAQTAPMQLASASQFGDPAQWKAGEPGIVSNGPVLDTPQNRALYGAPDSRAGRRTSPTGD